MRIAIYAFDGVSMFHLASPQTVFGSVGRLGLADWRPVLFTDSPGAVRLETGYGLGPLPGLGAARSADVLIVPSWHIDGRDANPDLLRALQRAHDRGATVAGLCLGTFPVAQAGLLDGRSAVTHWRAAPTLARLHPAVSVDEQALYIDHGDVLTSAGTASAIDACLHLVRTRLGARAANAVARSMVVAAHREGGQAQYIDRPLPDAGDDTIARLMEWAEAHISEDLPVERLARMTHMSTRSLVRRFRAATGATPAAWVRSRRLNAARALLEGTEMPIERVADECGFASAVTMRQVFDRALGTTPSAYRRSFSPG